MPKQLVNVNYARSLEKLEQVLKTNDMILADIKSMDVGIFIPARHRGG